MSVSIKINGLAAAKGAIRQLQRLAPEKLKAAVAESAINIQREATRRAPVDVGILRNSYKWEFEPGTTSITGVVFSDSKYAPWVEFGTKPHFPPVEPLEEWARRHGMPPGTGFLIARKIAQRGTPAQPHLGPAAEEERNTFERNVKLAVLDAARESAR
jgi:hypothetical protein